VRDLKLDLFFNLGRHPVMLPKNQPIDKFILRGRSRPKLALRGTWAGNVNSARLTVWSLTSDL
jgi:hypothetical protein